MTDHDHPPVAAEKGTLYVVATPLGNLGDITRRALDILAAVDHVAAEDTRDTTRLLAHFGLVSKCFALHRHNERTGAAKLLELLSRGESVALVSDAGTPGISDPGGLVVAAARAAGHRVVPVPGPSALTAALSVAGLAETGFVFAGFLPPKSGPRRNRIQELDLAGLPMVFYEAPHRIAASLADLEAVCGGARAVVVARELTKLFEEVHRCPLAEAQAWLAADRNRQRGEFVLIVEARAEPAATARTREAETVLHLALEELPPARAAKLAAKITGGRREELYELALKLNEAKTHQTPP
ncbi:MAG: 16S rRNA (cytidine(1402)-2'-O)-methyltransferase [Betaproteobacteria bacterium]|nr:16S rRNA (cytidine(1402)-2'-O)-methyltransferase [Betaproteobacteria bacterium]